MTPRLQGVVGLVGLVVAASAARADEPPAPDPFVAPPDPFAAPPDPFAAPSDPRAPALPPPPAPAFDPSAVIVTPRGLVLELPGALGSVIVHGRANATLALVHGGDERVELLDSPTSIELSSGDLYAEWFPCAWFGLLGEVEVEDDLEEETRSFEVELDLLIAEVRPLGDERLRLRAGWAPLTFGIERRTYSPPRNEAITRPAAFRRVFPGTVTDVGVSAWLQQPLGVLGRAELEVGLTRGLDGPARWGRVEAFAPDDDHRPQVAGRVGWTLVDLDPARDEHAPLRLVLAAGGSGLLGGYEDAGRERRRIRMAGADVVLQVGELLARGELVVGDVEHGARGPGGPPELVRGGYVTVSWRRELELPGLDALLVVGRWERLDAGRLGLSALDLERWYAGVGWVPVDGLLVKAGWEQSRARTLAGTERAGAVLLEVGYSF